MARNTTVQADLNAPPITRTLAAFVAQHPSRGWSDAVEHEAWAARLKAKGLNPRAPWTRQTDLLTIRDGDAISDSGVEIWNLLEQRGIKNVMLLGVHVNMCVAGDRKSTRLNSSHSQQSRMPSSA